MDDIHRRDERSIEFRLAAQPRHAEGCLDIAEVDTGAVETVLEGLEQI